MEYFSYFKIFWERCLKLQILMGDGVDETEFVGMKTESSDLVVTVSVFGIANHRETNVLQVDTNLVLAAGVESELDQRVSVGHLY